MSKIDKLSILGIRSFDNKQSETIQFYSPLTLIVGSNGSGKTTIIECLKYATTGDQPPNTKGGAFIHDPKLCSEREVLAQVKLSFWSTSAAKMVATRSLQLTVKKQVRSMKTLEGQLMMIKNHERMSVSSRVAELDQVLPQYLGVSKAILDNVVFCHQDESLWPLSEPGTLKKKFDEIFEAQKYTKAIDNIKVLRKKQTEEYQKLKIYEEQAKNDKDRADKAKEKTERLNQECEEMRTEWDDLDEKLKLAAKNAEEAWQQAAQFDQIIVKLEGKRTEARLKNESIQDAKHDLKEMSESDETLQNMLDQQDERARTYKRDIDAKSRAYEDVIHRSTETQNELGRKQRDHGKYQAEQAQYERQLEQRTALVKDTAVRHKIRGFDYDITNDRARDFLSRMSTLAKEQERARKRAHDEAQQDIRQAQEALDKLNQEKSTLSVSKENASTQASSLERKIQGQQASLNRMDVDEGAQARLHSSVSDTRNNLEAAKKRLDEADFDKGMQNSDRSVKELRSRLEKINNEMHHANKHASETAEIDLLRKTLRETEQGLATMKGAHGDELSKLLGRAWDTDLEANYEELCQQKSKDLAQAEQRRDQCQRELDQNDYKLNSLKSEVKQKEKEKDRYESHIQDVIGDEDMRDFHKIIQEREVSYADLSSASNVLDYYAQCQEYFEQKNACKLCGRGFSDQAESKRLEKKLKKFLTQESKDQKDELEQVKQDLSSLRELIPTYETWARLIDREVPSMRREVAQYEDKRSDYTRRLERQHDAEVSKAQDAKYDAEKVRKNVQAIVRYQSDAQATEKKIADYSSKQSQGNQRRGLDEISQEQKKVDVQVQQAQLDLQRLQVERQDARDNITNLELALRDAQAKVEKAATSLREKQSVQTQIDELISSRNEHRDSINRTDEKLQTLLPSIKSAQEKYDNLQRRADERQSALTEDLSKVQNSLNQLQSAQNEISAYQDRNGPQQLQQAERDISNIKNEQSKIEQETRQLTVEINKLKQEQQKHTDYIKGIERNLKYRSNMRALQGLQSEIADLEAHNAESDRDYYNREASKWQTKRNKLSGEQSSITGQIKSKDDQLSQLILDYETDFKDAPKRYREAKVKLIATKSAIEDLGRYGGALDKAIMKYHSLKMDEINTLIEELWQKTYRGTDVDTILIRSDNESLKGNKSYNYRVCMVKQDVEMDMRGRCSAGQKVLASIIIRLALAECFGVSCGLIALDEPTTNLDHDNICSLARSLHDIIMQRKAQSNFQLIVITHDEGFLREMNCSDFTDYYYRVSRNDKQRSQIERQSIGEVM